MSNLLPVTVACLCVHFWPNVACSDERAATQGEFAVRLAEKLGHKRLPATKAIELLSRLSILPGIGPNAAWNKDGVATTKFVADIQASLQVVLKNAAQSLSISPPPTLDLYVFELPPAPQRATFPSAQQLAAGSDGGGKPPHPPSMPPPMPGSPGFYGPPPPLESLSMPPDAQQGGQRVLGTATKPAGGTDVDDRIISAFADAAEVPVIVELRPDQSTDGRSATEADVAAAQDAVLSTLEPKEFRLKHKYATVLSFSGWITKAGLMKLQQDDSVLRIHFDALERPQGPQ